MNELINSLTNDFELDSELEVSLEKITEHVVNKDFYYRNAYYATKNPDIRDSFINKNCRRSYYYESGFYTADFSGAGFTDSIFRNTNFENCIFDSSNFESCYLFNCNFINQTPYKSASFAKSFLYNTYFRDISFDRCKLSDVIFHDSILEGCVFDNTAFDGTCFNNTILDSVSFKNLNLEYAQFNGTQIHDTALPFPTIPFIINGIDYLIHTTDKVYIKSAKKEKLSKEEYISLLPYLKIYYKKTSNYFPLANIYIAENDINNAYESIKSGMCFAINLNNYRQLKNYCILVSSSGLFNIEQKKSFIEMISRMFNEMLLTHYAFYYSITEHFLELKNILLSSSNASLIVSFKTNIKNDDYKLLSLLYKTVDLLISTVGIQSNYSVNFSYNSNAEIIATINSIDTSIIVALITAFTTLLISGIKGIANMPDVILKFTTIKQKIQKEKLAIESQELENKKMRLEISKLEKEINKTPTNSSTESLDRLINNIEPVLANCDALRNQGVHIESINYNSINIDINTLTEYTSNLIYNTTNFKD